MKTDAASTGRTIAIVGHQAFSLSNFRGDLIADLVAAGNRVIAMAPDYDVQSLDAVESLGAIPSGYWLNRSGMNPFSDGLAVLNLAWMLRRHRPDALLCYSTKPVILGSLGGWLAGVQHRVALIEGLGYSYTLPKENPGLKRTLLRKFVSFLFRVALHSVHRVIVLNHDDRAELLREGVVESSKVQVLDGIGVNLGYWQPLAPSLAPVTFLMAARLLVEKGVREFAEAAQIVKSKHKEVRFVLVGGLDSNPGGISLDEVNSWVSCGVLEWPGHVDVRSWLKHASVFVLPSYREGLPRSTQEAMASGLPVITTDVPGCRQTVVDGVNGYVVAPRDSVGLAQAMMKFLDCPHTISQMGAQSLAMAVQRFDAKRANQHLADALESSRGSS